MAVTSARVCTSLRGREIRYVQNGGRARLLWASSHVWLPTPDTLSALPCVLPPAHYKSCWCNVAPLSIDVQKSGSSREIRHLRASAPGTNSAQAPKFGTDMMEGRDAARSEPAKLGLHSTDPGPPPGRGRIAAHPYAKGTAHSTSQRPVATALRKGRPWRGCPGLNFCETHIGARLKCDERALGGSRGGFPAAVHG